MNISAGLSAVPTFFTLFSSHFSENDTSRQYAWFSHDGLDQHQKLLIALWGNSEEEGEAWHYHSASEESVWRIQVKVEIC